MKGFLVITALIVFSLVIGLVSRFWLFSKDKYISKDVLEIAMPFSVKIDEGFLKELVPAYERK